MAKAKIKSGDIFERCEKKYLLTKDKYNELLDRLRETMEIDEYGLHTIHTLYYDNEDFEVIRHSISNPEFKEKLRLRSYGQVENNQAPVFLELKKKVAGVTYKRRVKLFYQEAMNYLRFGEKPRKQGQIFKEIDQYISTFEGKLRPITKISYDRLALIGKKDPDFRITFDFKIRYSLEQPDLSLKEQEEKQDFLNHHEEEMVLMEVKVLGAFPLKISRLFSELNIFQEKFTKYGNLYRWVLYPTWEQDKIGQTGVTYLC